MSNNLAYVGLGANLGDPVQQVIDARAQLNQLDFVCRMRCSSLYISSPVGYLEQDNFVNCVVELEVAKTHNAYDLFAAMQQTEYDLGRVRDANNRNAARKIDCDLLLFSEQRLTSPELLIPHPRIAERLFVLLPLQELLEQKTVNHGLNAQQLLDQGYKQGLFHDQKIYRIG